MNSVAFSAGFDEPKAVTLDANGNIVIVGQVNVGDNEFEPLPGSQFALARFLAHPTAGSGMEGIVVAGGQRGQAPRVSVFDASTGQGTLDFLAFNASFAGGVFVA